MIKDITVWKLCSLEATGGSGLTENRFSVLRSEKSKRILPQSRTPRFLFFIWMRSPWRLLFHEPNKLSAEIMTLENWGRYFALTIQRPILIFDNMTNTKPVSC